MLISFQFQPLVGEIPYHLIMTTHWVSSCGEDCHHVRPNNEVFVFAFRMKVFKWSWFYSFWLGGRKLLVHCPCRFIGLFWSKYMSGRESNERMTLVFSQVIISPTLQWHISSKFASSSHDPQFIGAHHVRSLPYLSLQWIDNTKVKPFASNYWSTCLLHRIRKVSSNHLIYSSKGNKSLTLESYICHWNYIQIFIHSSNTRFCMLKVILKLMVSTLDFKSWVVFTCMFLYTHMH